MRFCRIQALIEELLMDWDKLNLAAKLLVYIGFFLVFSIIFMAIYKSKDTDLYARIEVIFRISLASVFGFILSSNTKNSNKKNTGTKSLTRKSNEEHKDICERIREYDYGDGNSVQISIALIITVISAIVILIIYKNNIHTDRVILSQFRDLMCTSIGFLLGESKIRSD